MAANPHRRTESRQWSARMGRVGKDPRSGRASRKKGRAPDPGRTRSPLRKQPVQREDGPPRRQTRPGPSEKRGRTPPSEKLTHSPRPPSVIRKGASCRVTRVHLAPAIPPAPCASGGDRLPRRHGHQMRPRPRHHVRHRVPAPAQRDPLPPGVLVRQRVARLRHHPLRVQRSPPDAPAGPRRACPPRAARPPPAAGRPPPAPAPPRERPAATRRPRSRPAARRSPRRPPPACPPVSSGHPVCGKSVRGDSCSEIVSTRGSSQNAACTPSPWCTSTSTYTTRSAPSSSSRATASAASL